MVYQLKISPLAEKDIIECFDYLAFSIGEVGNPLVADKFYHDLELAFEKITDYPEGFPLCDDEDLAKSGLRRIKLSHYHYDVFYHIIDNIIIIDMVCHNLRDYGKILGDRTTTL